MKNVLLIISFVGLLFSCKNENSFNFKDKSFKKIENDELVDSLQKTIIGECNNCGIDSLKIQFELFKRTDYDTLKHSNENQNYSEDTINFIDLGRLSFIDVRSRNQKNLNFYVPRYSYSSINSLDNFYITKVHCNSNTLTITLSQQSIDELYMKFSIMKNKFILKKIYMKDHYFDYLEYINELDTAIVYSNNSVVDINHILELINKTPTKKIITDSTSYKLSLPK